MAEGVLPLEHLLAIMRDPTLDTYLRLKAAIAAAPYCHSKMATIHHSGSVQLCHDDWVRRMSEGEDEGA